MATSPAERITAERYLAMERAADFKSEYINGRIYAMAGGTADHSAIAVNVAAELRAALRLSGCRVFNSDLKIYIPFTNSFVYPDASVICGEVRYKDEARDVAMNPILVIEVLSPSTSNYDRGDKFAHYRSIPTFREYLIIQQTPLLIEQWALIDGCWTLRNEYKNLDDRVQLISIKGSFALADVFDGVAG
jgi:Uma2 family endonuclease